MVKKLVTLHVDRDRSIHDILVNKKRYAIL